MFLAKPAQESLARVTMHFSMIGSRLIARTFPLLMAAVLLAFGCAPTPKPLGGPGANERAARAGRP